MIRLITGFCLGLTLLVLLPSCVSTSKTVYFNSIGDTRLQAGTPDLEPVIQKGDLLSISVSSLNPEASIIFNTPNVATVNASATGGGGIQSSGYLVNQDGTIQFPILGNIPAAGLTKKAFKETLSKELSGRKLLVDPIVNVRYLNFRVTVLGEVARPTVVTVPSEQITILEALGLAGDLTIFGKRENVLVIREEGGQRIVKRLDLTKSEVLTSPYYYLKSNDVIYVEPNKARIGAASSGRQVLPLVLSALSFAAIVIDRVVAN